MIGVRIIGAVLFVGAMGCAIASWAVLSDMVEDISRVSPEQKSPMNWHFGKLRRVLHRYPMLCPVATGISNILG